MFDKKQQDSASGRGDSSSSKTKGLDNSNTEGISKNNNNDKNYQQGTNDGRSNSRQSVEHAKTGKEVERGGGENVAPPTVTTAPTPESQTSCKQGSNCTGHQGLSDHDRSSTTSSTNTLEQDNGNTPFVLSLPFP